MNTKTMLNIAILLISFIGLTASEARASNFKEEANEMHQKHKSKISKSKLVGAWKVNIFPNGGGQFVNLLQVNADYTATGSDTAGGVGIGIWRQVKKGNFEFKQISLCECEGLPAGSYVEVWANMDYLKQSDSLDGTFTTTIYAPDDTILNQFYGDATADRISF